jgi:signal transduction histidine kinase
MAKKNFRQAIGYFKAAVPQFGETPDRENLAYAYEMLSKSYEDLGQMDSALFFYKRYSNIRDSVLTQEANGKLEEIKAQYETEKKEHQNQLLTAQNAVLFRSRNIYLALASLLAALLFTLSYFFIKNRKQKRQIEQQKNELEENARLKSKLFSIVAHDLRSPLVSLGGIAKKVNFLIQRNRVEEVQQLGESVEQAVSHVHKLLDNLLSWAMVQGGRFPHEPENIQLAGTLRETVELYRHSAEAKNITLLYDAPTDLQIRCDKNAFSTIVRNLLDNAIKFTPPNGQVALEAKLEKDFALIQVIDSGTGIDEATKQHLFAISGKKGAEGTHGEKGTGLGLSLCKELVEMNGGKIDVSSREGLGTTFRVLLPFIN